MNNTIPFSGFNSNRLILDLIPDNIIKCPKCGGYEVRLNFDTQGNVESTCRLCDNVYPINWTDEDVEKTIIKR